MSITILNYLLSRLKGEDYKIDQDVSSSYLLSATLKRIKMLIKGKLSFIYNKGTFFLGSHVNIKARKYIRLGKGVSIDDYCYLDAHSKNGILFGNNVSLGKNTVIECSGSFKYLGKGLVVGDNVGLGRDCFYGCAGGVEIGSDTIIGNYVSFHSENHNISEPNILIRLQGVNHKGIKIGNNCWIGAKVTILDGAIISDGCVIAAGAVVSAGFYDANCIYGGVPAKLIKRRCAS